MGGISQGYVRMSVGITGELKNVFLAERRSAAAAAGCQLNPFGLEAPGFQDFASQL